VWRPEGKILTKSWVNPAFTIMVWIHQGKIERLPLLG